MNNYLIPRLQFEIRFNHILDFSRIIKKYANPFLKFSKSFNIQNDGTINDIFVLNFEEGFHIDCRWDRFVLVSEGKVENYSKETSAPLAMFFDLFNKFAENEAFGEITNHLLVLDFIKINDLNTNENLKIFYNKYVKIEKDYILNGWNDIGLTFIKKTDSEEISVIIGPYLEDDILKRNLFPFKSTLISEIKDKNGFTMQYKHFVKEKNVNYKIFFKSFSKGIETFDIYLKSLING